MHTIYIIYPFHANDPSTETVLIFAWGVFISNFSPELFSFLPDALPCFLSADLHNTMPAFRPPVLFGGLLQIPTDITA